ncbi:kinase-like protein [Terfezia boudieri ATCC MYA-4762]|uniref:Kinase-like protein n=1 Tax=Terfezia boudieri ATCC MYA-4762 TaxID=1051890 RepID=A0A3N4LDK9_9PEZI|nr:kinase-like protein [Terfezia boudieri ATCC MYA-4762]
MTSCVTALWYRAPEVILNPTLYNKALDIWSVGCIFAHLLRGKPLFKGDNQLNQIIHIIRILGTPFKDDMPQFLVKGQLWLRTQLPQPPTPLQDIYPAYDNDTIKLLFHLL